MKIRKDFVTNSSSSNFLLQTIFSIAPTAGVVFGALSSNMAQMSQSSQSGVNVSVSGASPGETIVLDGKEAIKWLTTNGFWNKDKKTFTEAFWNWHDSFYSESSDSLLMGICGDYNSEDRENINLTNIAIAVKTPQAGPSVDKADGKSKKPDDSSGQSSNESTPAEKQPETKPESETEDHSETKDATEDKSDQTSDSSKADSAEEKPSDDTSKTKDKKTETKPGVSPVNLVDKMNKGMDKFLNETDRKLLEGKNVTVHLEIKGENAQTIQIAVVDGVPQITSGASKNPNITISFNEVLINNLKKLKASEDSKEKQPSVSDILNIEVKSDKTHNDLAMKLLNNKLDGFVKDKTVDSFTAKAISATFRVHLASEVFGKLTGFVGSFFEKEDKKEK